MTPTRLAALLAIGAMLMAQAAPNAQDTRQPDAQHHGKAHLKNADGSWKYTNALAKETSPYLLQHAHNPVDWHPWGKEAFDLARKRGVPIFLSIGYSTCYWCHVMERQVFENEAIAKQMNRDFVCIKVDREERPDIDDIYMTATQMMTGGGGWPMSVFLTPPASAGEKDPGLKPFFAGTYFPPEPMRGMPGFPQVMEHLTAAWRDRRGDVNDAADNAANAIRQHMTHLDLGGELSIDLVRRATMQLLRSYDPAHGGYGRAPKFPQPNNLLLLMAVQRSNPNEDLWKSVTHTLDRMARGGMYDQIGGGFHRYSTDAQWLVPHFEKMLYDNGQLVEAYLEAQSIAPDPGDKQHYARVVRETCDYVLREMTDKTGAFWSAQDAEVNAREGGNYVWTPDEIKAAIKDESLAALALEMYGLDRGTNFQDPHHADEPRTNVIYLPIRLDDLAKKHNITVDEMAAKRKAISDALYPVRMQRPQPGTDDKVLVAWNGLMIAGLARAGHDLNESRYTDAAAKAARYILDHMVTDAGGLRRSMRGGTVKIDGFLEDYAFFAHGLIALHRATDDSAWLEAAKKLMAAASDRFADPRGGYFDTLADRPDLFVRTRSTYDGALSSGNSQMVHNWIDLYELTKDKTHLERAYKDLRSFAAMLDDRGVAMTHMQHALLRALEADPKLAIEPLAAAAPEFGDEPPVKLAVAPGEVMLGKGPVAIKITVKIAKGYHINAANPGNDSLVATELRLEQAKGYDLKVKYPAPMKKKFAFADEPIAVYEGEIVIEATIAKNSDADAKAKPVLVLQYQACTDKACLRPKEIEAPVRFQ